MLSQEDYKIIEQYIKQKNGKVETVPMNEKNGKLYPSSLKITLYRDDVTNTKRENELVFYIRQGEIDEETNQEKEMTMNQFLRDSDLSYKETYSLTKNMKAVKAGKVYFGINEDQYNMAFTAMGKELYLEKLANAILNHGDVE